MLRWIYGVLGSPLRAGVYSVTHEHIHWRGDIYYGEENAVHGDCDPRTPFFRVASLTLVYAGECCLSVSGPVPAYTQAKIVVLVGAVMDIPYSGIIA